MIIPMKMLTILCMKKDRGDTVDQLANMGLLHVEHVLPPTGKKLEQAEQAMRKLRVVLDQLPKAGHTNGETRPPPNKNPEQLVEKLAHLIEQKELLNEKLKELRRLARNLEPFGDFDPQQAKALAEQGIRVQLFETRLSSPLEPTEDGVLTELSRNRTCIFYSYISQDPIHPENATAVPLPEHRLAELQKESARHDAELEDIDTALREGALGKKELEKALAQGHYQVRLQEALSGMGRSESVVYIRGYCPEDLVEVFNSEARVAGWGVMVDDPPDPSKVPTLLKNPAWVAPIKSVLNFISINPGYHEVDISSLFLLFFSLFFAMIVGDAGYGLLFLLGAFAWKKRMPPELFNLLTIMSGATIVWGLLTGNIFGLAVLPEIFKPLEIPALSVHNTVDGQQHVMGLCFLIGAIHLTIAHGWKAWQLRQTPRALAQIGWILTTWVMFFTARTMVLLKPFPPVMLACLALGVTLIILFMTAPKQLKTQWFYHVMVPLDLINNFVDVVSYVRLFAVGMATFAMASAFNQMGAEMASNGLGGQIAAVFIIGLGHALNIILAAMGVLVHGIRLNTLEFSGHLGLTWAGIKYNPLTQRPLIETTE